MVLIGKAKPGEVAPVDADGDAVRRGEDDEQVEQVDEVDPGSGRLARVAHRLGRKRWLVPVGVVVVVALVAGAFFAGRGSSGHQNKARSAAPPGFVTYQNHKDGFSISYPKQWRVVPDPKVPLLLSAGGNDALSVRVLTLQQPIDPTNVASIKAVTDSILSSPSAHLQVLLSRPITIAGIGGYYYLYTFPSGNDVGVHAHYFLFQGRKLMILVFQALPVTDFKTLAPIFDQVSASFHSNPAILGPTPAPAPTSPSTTAPGATAPGTTAPGTAAPGATDPGATAPGSPPAPATTAPAPTAPGGPPGT